METKICTKCGKEKLLTEFNWRNKSKGTLRSECKECHTAYMKQKYQEKKTIVQDIKNNLKCAKCGYDEYPIALDFHHLDPTQKDTTVARMVANNYRLDKTLQEIDKCICLCANCHRVFHFLEKEQKLTIEEFLEQECGEAAERSRL